MGKKDFGSLKSPIGNTALNFISADAIAADVEHEEVKEEKKTEEVEGSNGRRRAGRPKLRGETKSQRVVLLLKPSMYEEIHEEADSMDVSVNEFYEILLKDYFEKKKFK